MAFFLLKKDVGKLLENFSKNIKINVSKFLTFIDVGNGNMAFIWQVKKISKYRVTGN